MSHFALSEHFTRACDVDMKETWATQFLCSRFSWEAFVYPVTSRCPGSAAALHTPACTLDGTQSNAESFFPERRRLTLWLQLGKYTLCFVSALVCVCVQVTLCNDWLNTWSNVSPDDQRKMIVILNRANELKSERPSLNCILGQSSKRI